MLEQQLEEKLIQLANALVDQNRATTIVPPKEAEQGFWFGGGNMIEDPQGHLHVVGRYRNGGDSRTGLKAGERGCELAFFTSMDRGKTFEKSISFNKSDLNVGQKEVLSIEGAAIQWTDEGIELFVSTEKDHVGYPAGFEDHLKPGTGVWSIEKLQASSLDGLKTASLETVLSTENPECIHMKDPFLYHHDHKEYLLFCSHPYCWTSSNTGYALRQEGGSYDLPLFDFFPRGMSWDVAMTRGTSVLDLPQVGAFKEIQVSLIFYDGGECVRNLDEHKDAVSRPRGYSCEELGGVGYFLDGNLSKIQRLSVHQPMFISPHGTGCSRYVDVLNASDGYYTTWQQSQADCSQPLVMNFLPHTTVQEILG